MTWLTGDFLSALSAPALLLLGFLFFMLGLIRPRSAIVEVRADRDSRLADIRAERDDWREAHRISEAARETLAASQREQLELARAAVDALKGFRAAASWLEQERGDTT